MIGSIGHMVTKMESIVQDTSILPPNTCPPHHNIATIQTEENNWPYARPKHVITTVKFRDNASIWPFITIVFLTNSPGW